VSQPIYVETYGGFYIYWLIVSSHLQTGLPSLSFRRSDQNPIRISLNPHACYMPSPLHLPWIVQVTKLLIMQFPSTLISLRPKYSPQHRFQTLSVYVPLLMSEAKFKTHTKPEAELVLYILIFTIMQHDLKCCLHWGKVKRSEQESTEHLLTSRTGSTCLAKIK
jgi:hypothetical protein